MNFFQLLTVKSYYNRQVVTGRLVAFFDEQLLLVNLIEDAFNLLFSRDLPPRVVRNSGNVWKSCKPTFHRVKIPIYKNSSPLRKETEAGDLQKKNHGFDIKIYHDKAKKKTWWSQWVAHYMYNNYITIKLCSETFWLADEPFNT